VAGDSEAADIEGVGDDAGAEDQVGAHHLVPEQHLREVASHGDLLYRIGERSSLDPESHGPPKESPVTNTNAESYVSSRGNDAT